MKALRNLYITLRSMPVVTGLNIFGLAVAISVAYMIFVQVNHELSFNKGIKDADRTALIMSDGNFMGERKINTNMSRGAVEFIRNSVPMVEKVGSINILGDRRGGCTEDNPEGFLFNVSNILYPATTLEMFPWFLMIVAIGVQRFVTKAIIAKSAIMIAIAPHCFF